MASGQPILVKPARTGRPRHYAIDRWIDFARGLESNVEAVRMKKHAASCTECKKLMTFCEKLTATARFMVPPKFPSDFGDG